MGRTDKFRPTNLTHLFRPLIVSKSSASSLLCVRFVASIGQKIYTNLACLILSAIPIEKNKNARTSNTMCGRSYSSFIEMRRKTPRFSYGDIRRVRRICVSN